MLQFLREYAGPVLSAAEQCEFEVFICRRYNVAVLWAYVAVVLLNLIYWPNEIASLQDAESIQYMSRIRFYGSRVAIRSVVMLVVCCAIWTFSRFHLSADAFATFNAVMKDFTHRTQGPRLDGLLASLRYYTLTPDSVRPRELTNEHISACLMLLGTLLKKEQNTMLTRAGRDLFWVYLFPYRMSAQEREVYGVVCKALANLPVLDRMGVMVRVMVNSGVCYCKAHCKDLVMFTNMRLASRSPPSSVALWSTPRSRPPCCLRCSRRRSARARLVASLTATVLAACLRLQ